MTTLWERIDTYLETELMTELGAYSTLKLQAVEIDEVWQQATVETRSQFPFIQVRGFEMTQKLGGFGDGLLHTDNTYPYLLICAVKSATRRQAKKDAQEMLGRMRLFMRRRPVLNRITADDSEVIDDVVLDRCWIETRGKSETQSGVFYGAAVLAFTVETHN